MITLTIRTAIRSRRPRTRGLSTTPEHQIQELFKGTNGTQDPGATSEHGEEDQIRLIKEVGMSKKFVKIWVFFLLLMWLFGCNLANSERSSVVTTNANLPIPEPTEIFSTKFRDESVGSLCKRLHEIKKLPYRDPNDTDPIYEALIARGKQAMPCLIEKITDETPMRDPREAPVWQHYKVGDTAVFILADIAKDEEILQQMLPAKYRKEWETNGVYAYFNYVSESENREELQRWWQIWLESGQKQ